MFGVCYVREKDWEQDQWSYVFSNFGVTEIWELGDDGNKDMDIYQQTTKIDTAAELPTDRPLVVLAPPEGRFIQGTENLETFQHPDNAIYLFGGSHISLNDEEHMGGRVADHYVYIEWDKCESFSHATAIAVLWDRKMKNGR